MTAHVRALEGAIELKDDGGSPDVITKAIADLTQTVDERLKAVETKTADRLDKVEAKLNRPAVHTKAQDDNETSVETKAFASYLALGDRAPETKTLRVSSDPAGGYFAPAEVQAEFIRNLVEFSPIRGIASVRATTAPSVIYPTRTAITNAKWRGETAASEGSEPSFGQLEVPVREMTTHVDLANQLLQDGAGANQEVTLALAEDFAGKEGLAFVNGTGPLSPEGFMANADVAHTVNGHATNLSADALITLMYALPAAYRSNGTWVLNGVTLGTIRKLKDGQGNHLWQPSYQAGQPETILGRPVVEAIDMPDVASGAFPIIYGDFGAAYRIVDRLDMSVLVNPYLLATNGITRIHATRRVGAAVIRPGALRKLKMAAS